MPPSNPSFSPFQPSTVSHLPPRCSHTCHLPHTEPHAVHFAVNLSFLPKILYTFVFQLSSSPAVIHCFDHQCLNGPDPPLFVTPVSEHHITPLIPIPPDVLHHDHFIFMKDPDLLCCDPRMTLSCPNLRLHLIIFYFSTKTPQP